MDPVAHLTHVRAQPAGFIHAADGWWVSDYGTGEPFEVICEDCGDDSGPIDSQTDKVQAIRGPYATKAQAWRIGAAHRG